MMLAQLRHYDYMLDDPLIDGWLETLGDRLGAASDKPQQPFTFFMLRDRQINAFATLGGYIGVNAGLVLAAEREDEVAAVLSHEIAHVTQEHVLRAVERAQRDQMPILLAMLGAIVVAQAAGGNSSRRRRAGGDRLGAGPDGSSARSTTPAPTNPRPTASASRPSPAAGYDPEAMAGLLRAHCRRASRGNRAASASARPTTCRPTRSPPRASARPRQRAEQIARAPQRLRRPTPAPATTRCCRAACRSARHRWRARRHRPVRLGARTPARAQRRHPGRRDPRIRAHAPAQARSTTRSATAWRWPACATARPRPRRPSWPTCCSSIPATPGWRWRWARPRRAPASRAPADARFEALLRAHAAQPRGRADLRRRAGRTQHAAAGKRAQAVLRPLLAHGRRGSGVPADLRPRQRDRRRPGPRRRGLCRGRVPERPPGAGAGAARTR